MFIKNHIPEQSLEICAYGIESAIIAEAAGADRIELCENRNEGGTTPSLGVLSQCLEYCSIPIMCMIRPRGGDFLYSSRELECMAKDIAWAKKAGAAGVVFGLLKKDGKIDKENCRMLLDIAGTMHTTFHRAFDMSRDPREALEDIIDLGFDFILSSGQEKNVDLGANLLKEMVIHAAGRIQIIAGAGVHAGNTEKLIFETGVKHIHTSASHSVSSHMKYRNPRLHMGDPNQDEYSTTQVSAEKVAAVLKEANKAWKSGKI